MGIAKQEIYRRLGVRELWTMKSDGTLLGRVLEKDVWIERPKSKVLPKLDVAWLISFLNDPQHDTQTGAVRALRAALRKKR